MYSDFNLHIHKDDKIVWGRHTHEEYRWINLRIDRDGVSTEIAIFVNNDMWEEFKTVLKEALDDDGTTEVVGAGRTEESVGGPAQEGEDAA